MAKKITIDESKGMFGVDLGKLTDAKSKRTTTKAPTKKTTSKAKTKGKK